MNIETEKKILIFEGLSCCGKTSLINKLSSDCAVTPVIKRIPRDLALPTPGVFMRNDEVKFSEAKNCPGIALMDRGYLSTLVFYTVMEEINREFSAREVKKWVAESIGRTIFKPDYYIFIDIPPEISRDRARQEGRPFDQRNLWVNHTERMLTCYWEYFTTLERNVPLIKLDGTMSMTSVQKELELFIAKLKKG